MSLPVTLKQSLASTYMIHFYNRLPLCSLSTRLLANSTNTAALGTVPNILKRKYHTQSIGNKLRKFSCGLLDLKQNIGCNRCQISTSSRINVSFNEEDEKAGYGKDIGDFEAIRLGLKDLRQEINKWKHEMKVKVAQDPLIVFPGDRDKIWVFDGRKRSPTSTGYCSNPSDEASVINPITSENSHHDVLKSGSEFDGWIVTCDKDHAEGHTTAQLSTSTAGHGLFQGVLSTQCPKDGKIHYAGYANMRSLRPRRSFGRQLFFDWSDYTHLVIRCRGDGRSYIINLASAGYFDVSWNDMFYYVLYTRGGPHWQTYKVPFSKFIFSSKGTVQDKQSVVDPSRITALGLSVGDKINAPFRLELDYIAVESDPTHTEVTAYEMYAMPPYYAGY